MGKVDKPEKPVWWTFLRIGEGGWSSEYRSADLLLEHLKRKGSSVASRRAYCYNLWRICHLVEKILDLKIPPELTGDIAILDLKMPSELMREIRLTAERLKVDKIDPDKIILMIKENPEALRRLIQKIADKHNDLRSIRYANHIIALAKAFFEVNKVELDLKGYTQHTRSRKRQEYIPSLSEALKMADVAGSLRDRLIILFLTYTGLRNSTLRALVYNEAYPDPLLQEYTIKKQLDRGEEYLAIVVDEVMKERVPDACKNKIPYYTFIPPKVTECLRLYLCEMEEKYEAILDDQPIFHTENRRIPLDERLRNHISARELEEIVKNAAKRAGITNWKVVYPHCLRKTYESFLRNQPDDVRLDVKDREFLFGHTMPGSQDAYYDKTKIEEMRAKYARMIFEPIIKAKTEETVISEEELPNYLQRGWRFVATLPSGKVVVSREVILKQAVEATVTSSPTRLTLNDQKEDDQAKSKANTSEPFAPNNQSVRPDDEHSKNHLQHMSSPPSNVDPEEKKNLQVFSQGQSTQTTLLSDSRSVLNEAFKDEELPKVIQNSKTKFNQKTLFDFPS